MCLQNNSYKVLANKLISVLYNDMTQSAFFRERELLDNMLIANEAVDFLKKERLKEMIVKVDYEKAYDSGE